MRGTAKLAVEGIDAMLDAIYRWEAAADAFVATGSDDDDVVVTHDSRGKMIECWPRPGLQQELSVGELEQRINDAIAGNVARAQEGLNKIRDEFLAEFAELPERLAQHAVGTQFVDALKSAGSQKNSAAGGN